MTTGEARKLSDQVLMEPTLKKVSKLLILGVNRANPGFGDDAIFINRETGTWNPITGEFRSGTHSLRDQQYRAACDEYRENGWAYEDDKCEAEDASDEDLYDDGEDDEVERETAVIVPECAKFMTPGTELKVSYGLDDGDFEDPAAWKSDSYSFDIIEVPYGLSFHVNRAMDGVMLDKDFFAFPLVCWNTGDLPIKVDGKKIPAGEYLILLPGDPKRKERRLHYEDVMSIPIWDSEAEIAKNEQKLLALGCPPEDAHPLAGYFWRNAIYGVEDYDPADHAHWMNEVHGEGKPRPQAD